MKKLLLILFSVTLIFASCEDNNQAPNNSGNNNLNTYDWYFEIKVDGVSNRIEGSFNDASYYDALSHVTGPNKGYFNFGNTSSIVAILNNKGESTYINGEDFHIGLNGSNMHLGVNNLDLAEISGGADESFIGIYQFDYPGGHANALYVSGGSFYLSSLDTNYSGVNGSKSFPINITQLPTSSSINNMTTGGVDIGSPIIGSGSETIYVLDSIVGNTYSYTRAYNIEISFKIYPYF